MVSGIQKNPKLFRSFQNEQRDTTNFAVNEHVRTYLCDVCLLTSNDCRNDEHSDVTEGKTCEGVCIIWEKSVNITRSVFKFRANLAHRALPNPTIFQWKSSGHEVGFEPPSWVMWSGAFYNRGDHSRGTGEDAHQNDGTKPLRRPIWTKLKLYLPLKNRFHVAMMMSFGYSSFVIWILPKNFICPSGKLRIEITNPIAKSTNPGISDTTFFARCQKFILRRLQRPVAIQAKPAFLLLTQEDKKRLCYGRVRQQLLSCCCCCLCFRLLSLFSHGQS